MAKKISDINTLKQYLAGVLDRAEDHAGKVDEIALALAGAVIWRKDATDFRVFERKGEMKNVLWVKIGGKKYALLYNHEAETIELREDSTRGHRIASFNNNTSIHKVRKVFSKL